MISLSVTDGCCTVLFGNASLASRKHLQTWQWSIAGWLSVINSRHFQTFQTSGSFIIYHFYIEQTFLYSIDIWETNEGRFSSTAEILRTASSIISVQMMDVSYYFFCNTLRVLQPFVNMHFRRHPHQLHWVGCSRRPSVDVSMLEITSVVWCGSFFFFSFSLVFLLTSFAVKPECTVLYESWLNVLSSLYHSSSDLFFSSLNVTFTRSHLSSLLSAPHITTKKMLGERLLICTSNNQSTYPCVLLKQCVNWLELFKAGSEPLCCMKHPRFIERAHTQNRQLEDCEEQLADFDESMY